MSAVLIMMGWNHLPIEEMSTPLVLPSDKIVACSDCKQTQSVGYAESATPKPKEMYVLQFDDCIAARTWLDSVPSARLVGMTIYIVDPADEATLPR